MAKIEISEDGGQSYETVGVVTTANVVWEKDNYPPKDEFEYYMNRKGRFYFRNFYGKISFTTAITKELKKLKYGAIVEARWA